MLDLSSPRAPGTSKARLSLILAAFLFFASGSGLRAESDSPWADRTLRSLSLRDKIAQLVQIRVMGKFVNRQTADYQTLREQIRDNRIGGVVLFAGNVYESAILLNDLQTLSRLPLLVAADFERGLSFRIADTTSFPWTMAIGATGSEQFAYEQGLITARESRALGVHWIYAPVVDVNNNPDNPVINIRSFGEDPALVGKLGSAFIRGAKTGGVLTTAKHFPGHGDTATDTHLGLAVVESDLARLEAVEFVPFRHAIEAGVDSIMTAHLAVPKLTDLGDVPATLSWKVLTDVLRNRLKFDGLIVTDALEMAGITDSYWCGLAAIRALQAGADILMLPANATVAINEVERAVKRGELSEARINRSVQKVLRAKSRLELHVRRTVPLGRISEVIASPQSTRLAQEIADRSMVAVKDNRQLLPVHPLEDRRIFTLVLTPDLESSPGAVFQSEMKRHFSSVRTAWCNARMSEDLLTGIERMASDSDLTVIATFARLSTGQDTLALLPSQQALLRKIASMQKPLLWVAFGNPYALRLAPEVGTALCAFSYSDVSQIAAAKAIAGEIDVTGKMPVSIPGLSKAGDGLKIERIPMELKQESPERTGFEETKSLLTDLVGSGVFSGAELLVAFRNEILLDFSAGKNSTQPKVPGVSPSTFRDLASLSRLIGTASTAMLATDMGIFLPGTLVRDYLPEMTGKYDDKTRVRELLTSTAIGTESGAKLVEQLVARASGISAERFAAQYLYEPLGMNAMRTGAGISFRGRDLAAYAQMLLNRGVYRHRRYLKPETIAQHTGPRGLWSKPADFSWMGRTFSSSAFGHLSSAGPAIWIDPSKQLFIILLADGSGNPEAIMESQRKIIESVMPHALNSQ